MSTKGDSLIENTMQDQLNNLTKDIKKMTSSITIPINTSSAFALSDQNDSGVDPQTVLDVVNPQRVNEIEASQIRRREIRGRSALV